MKLSVDFKVYGTLMISVDDGKVDDHNYSMSSVSVGC